jgi:hypothetical protein
MTKRSSFVMPPVLAGVATMVDIFGSLPGIVDAKFVPMRRTWPG